MKIGVIVAMEKEMAQHRGLLADEESMLIGGRECITGRLDGKDIVVQQCGLGKVNAALGAAALIDCYHPDAVVSTGCAGGAQLSLQVGEVVASSELVYHDVYCGDNAAYGQVLGMPARYEADATLLAAAERLAAAKQAPRVVTGLTVTGDWFVDSREKMRDILNHFPDAMAVDMESAAIAQACYINKVAFLSFRIISDVPLSDHKASQYFDFWERMAQGSFDVTRAFIETL